MINIIKELVTDSVKDVIKNLKFPKYKFIISIVSIAVINFGIFLDILGMKFNFNVPNFIKLNQYVNLNLMSFIIFGTYIIIIELLSNANNYLPRKFTDYSEKNKCKLLFFSISFGYIFDLWVLILIIMVIVYKIYFNINFIIASLLILIYSFKNIFTYLEIKYLPIIIESTREETNFYDVDGSPIYKNSEVVFYNKRHCVRENSIGPYLLDKSKKIYTDSDKKYLDKLNSNDFKNLKVIRLTKRD